MILMISLLAVCLCGLIIWVVMKISELDDRQERLDKYSVHLDERANKLAQWEQELMNWEKEVGK